MSMPCNSKPCCSKTCPPNDSSTSSGHACRDYWARFEQFVRVLTHTCGDVYVVTGPLFLPVKTFNGYMMQHLMIGAPSFMPRPWLQFLEIMLGRCGRELLLGIQDDASVDDRIRQRRHNGWLGVAA